MKKRLLYFMLGLAFVATIASEVWVYRVNRELQRNVAQTQTANDSLRSRLLAQPSSLDGLALVESFYRPTSTTGGRAIKARVDCIKCGSDSDERQGFGSPLVGDANADGGGLAEIEKTVLPDLPRAAYTLFVMFSPSDCVACLQEVQYWNDLRRKGAQLKLNVIGIVDQSTRVEVGQFVRDLDITFPVVFDESGKVRDILAVRSTPLKILVNNATKTVILRRRAAQYQKEQKEFEDAVVSLLSK